MNEIEDLIARVKAATGPDREIENAIWDVCDRAGRKIAIDTADHNGYLNLLCPPAYTSSLDAIVALIKAKRSGWQINLAIFGSHSEASLGARGAYETHTAPTPELALCAALASGDPS